MKMIKLILEDKQFKTFKDDKIKKKSKSWEKYFIGLLKESK